jgi:hypothetical protein
VVDDEVPARMRCRLGKVVLWDIERPEHVLQPEGGQKHAIPGVIVIRELRRFRRLL